MKADSQEKPEAKGWVDQCKDQLQGALESPATAIVLAQIKADLSPPISVPEVPAFMGGKSCMSCHSREHDHWQKTGCP